ncbi:hypothetical protein ACFX10_029117 [Malus domestica]
MAEIRQIWNRDTISQTNNTSYTILPGEDPSVVVPPPTHRRPLKGFVVIFSSVIFLLSLVTLVIHQGPGAPQKTVIGQPDHHHQYRQASTSSETRSFSVLRGKLERVSAKSYPHFSEKASYNWTNAMLSWQRTASHFQPKKNWIMIRMRKAKPITKYALLFATTRSQEETEWYC